MVRLTLSAMSQSEDLQGSDRTPECFVLTFTGPAGGGNPRLMQNTYSVEHFALGRFDLFISEGALIGPDHVYTAVINRVAG